MATPPPPKYPPSVGLPTTWWSQTAAAVWTPENLAAADQAQQRTVEAIERIGTYITETPDERRRRQRDERDIAFEAAGETPRERARRHRAEDRHQQHAAQRPAALPWRHADAQRARRFRRWLALTFLSASLGYAVHLVQALGTGPAAYIALGAGWAGDFYLRGFGRVQVGAAAGGRRFVLVFTRVPYASGLAAACHLVPLLAVSGHLLNHH